MRFFGLIAAEFGQLLAASPTAIEWYLRPLDRAVIIGRQGQSLTVTGFKQGANLGLLPLWTGLEPLPDC